MFCNFLAFFNIILFFQTIGRETFSDGRKDDTQDACKGLLMAKQGLECRMRFLKTTKTEGLPYVHVIYGIMADKLL